MASLTSVLAPLRAAIVGLRIAAGEGSALEFQQVRNATKKAGGSSNNGRKTAGKRLGIKIHDGLTSAYYHLQITDLMLDSSTIGPLLYINRLYSVSIRAGAAANAGSIIVRQRGTTIHPGLNVSSSSSVFVTYASTYPNPPHLSWDHYDSLNRP